MIITFIHDQSMGLFNGNRYLLSMLCRRVVGLLMETSAIVYDYLGYKGYAWELYPGIANGRILTVELYAHTNQKLVCLSVNICRKK